VREVNQTPFREPGRSKSCGTSLRRHKGFAVACQEGSLTIGPAFRLRGPGEGLNSISGTRTLYMYIHGYVVLYPAYLP
jgi:hypothetical protein